MSVDFAVTVSAYIDRITDKQGKSFIMIRVYSGGRMARFSSGIKVHPSAWDGQNIVRSAMEPSYQDKNILLHTIIGNVSEISRDKRYAGDPNMIKAAYLERGKSKDTKKNNSVSLRDFAESFMQRYANKYAYNTIRKFRQFITAAESYRPGTTMDEINNDWLNGFCSFLLDSGKENSSIKFTHIKCLKNLYREASATGIRCGQDISQFTWKAVPKQPFAATWEEVCGIEALELETKLQNEVRDLFIISCYTGLRDSDIRNNINQKSIITQQGQRMIRIVMQKTGFDYHIPISDKVYSILKKYRFEIPIHPQQVFNREIKKIAGPVATEPYTTYHHYGARTEKRTVRRAKMFSSHTGRRTFGRRWIDRGGSLLVLSKIFGHSNTETTLGYIGYQPQEVLEEFKRVVF